MAEGRVLQLLGPSTGGIRRHVGFLAARLAAQGWGVEVAGPAGVMDGEGGQDHVLAVPGGPGPGLIPARRALARLAPEVDVIHAHGLKAGWLAALLGRSYPPVVVTVHNLVLHEAAGMFTGPLRMAEGLLPGRVAATIAVSPAIAARFGGPTDRLRVIPPAAPPAVARRPAATVRTELGVDGDAPLVVTVARLHPQKDLHTLLAALEIVRTRVPDVRAVIVGDGPLSSALVADARRRGLGDTVLFAGARPDAADILAAADAVAISSLWESGPIVAVEALQLARPLVSTPVGLVPDLVEDGESGLLVPIGDAVALAGALGRLLDDRSGAERMAQAGLGRVQERYDPDALVSRVADVYRATLSR